MKICLEDGTIYYEEGVVIKRGMTPDEVKQQFKKLYPNPEGWCLAGLLQFPPIPDAFHGVWMKAYISNTPVNYVQFTVPRIKGIPKSKEKQTEHLKKVIGEEIFGLLAKNENTCKFSWGEIFLVWEGRSVEMILGVWYR